MDTKNEVLAPAETFMAVVAIELAEKVVEFEADASTRCGSGMGQMKDD